MYQSFDTMSIKNFKNFLSIISMRYGVKNRRAAIEGMDLVDNMDFMDGVDGVDR